MVRGGKRAGLRMADDDVGRRSCQSRMGYTLHQHAPEGLLFSDHGVLPRLEQRVRLMSHARGDRRGRARHGRMRAGMVSETKMRKMRREGME
jgi:hypothetical protein